MVYKVYHFSGEERTRGEREKGGREGRDWGGERKKDEMRDMLGTTEAAERRSSAAGLGLVIAGVIWLEAL